MDWLIELAEATARPVSGPVIAAALQPFVERFADVWPDAAVGRVLADDLDVIAAVLSMPAVAVHGDYGTWNLLAMPDGRIGVLDWEASEDAGPPLWDLARLIHAYTGLTGTGIRPSGAFTMASAHLITGSALTPRLAGAVERSRSAAGLPAETVAPLIRQAWVARALKEVTRLRPDDLPRGHHARLVARTALRPSPPGWARLTGQARPDRH